MPRTEEFTYPPLVDVAFVFFVRDSFSEVKLDRDEMVLIDCITLIVPFLFRKFRLYDKRVEEIWVNSKQFFSC